MPRVTDDQIRNGLRARLKDMRDAIRGYTGAGQNLSNIPKRFLRERTLIRLYLQLLGDDPDEQENT